MSTTFKLDPEGDAILLDILGAKFAKFGNMAAESIANIAPRNTGRYAGTIQSTTFVDGIIYAGQPVRGVGVQSKAQIWLIVWTPSPLGHLLELGTGPRTVTAKPGSLMVWPPDRYSPDGGVAHVVHQPGTIRRPHFWPGFAAVAARASSILGGTARVKSARVNARVM